LIIFCLFCWHIQNFKIPFLQSIADTKGKFMGNWMARPGDENYDNVVNNAKVSKAFWFWTKPGEPKTVAFLDDERITINQHVVKIGQNFETYTCGGEDCYFCIQGERASTVEVYSILEILDKPYISKKDNKERRYIRKLIAIKGEAKERLHRRRMAAGGSLVGKKVEIIRDSKKSPSSGSDFEVKGDADLSKIPPEERKPYDYQDILAPLPVARQKAIYQYKSNDKVDYDTSSVSRSELIDATMGDANEDDIPF
jgi:hypothetical protein